MASLTAIWNELKSPRFGVPLVALATGCFLYYALFTDPNIDLDRPHNPATWPGMMTAALMAVAFVMLLWGLHDLWKERRNSGSGHAPANPQLPPAAGIDILSDEAAAIVAHEGLIESEHDNKKMVLGIVGIFGYGVAITYIGFAFATLLIIPYWLLICGWRRPIPIVLTGCGGTLAILFIFLKLAYMPLPKGVGVFHDMTIGLYRMLGFF